MDFEKLIYLGVGAIIGFALSLAKDWLMEGKRQKEKEKQFKRDKLEKLYILLDEFTEYIVGFYGSLYVSLRSNENSKEANERLEKINMRYLENYREIKVIFALYLFDELKDECEIMKKIQDSLGSHIVEFLENKDKLERDSLGEKIKSDISAWTNFMVDFQMKLPNIVKFI